MQSQSPFNPLTPHFTVLDIWRGFVTEIFSKQALLTDLLKVHGTDPVSYTHLTLPTILLV